MSCHFLARREEQGDHLGDLQVARPKKKKKMLEFIGPTMKGELRGLQGQRWRMRHNSSCGDFLCKRL